MGSWKAVGLPVILGGLTGCALFFATPDVQIVGVELSSLGLSSGVADVLLEVTNESSKEMEIRGFLYDLEVRDLGEDGDWIQLAEGFFDHHVSIPGGGVQEVRVPVPFEYAAVGAALRSFLAEGEVPYRIRGEVWVGGAGLGLQIPFRSRGRLKP
ncbi:LEA type 2 family protein [Gemmatimonadota bacterium]